MAGRDPDRLVSPAGTGRTVESPGLSPKPSMHTCAPPAMTPHPSAHSLSEKLPPLLPHQWAVVQGDRLHRAIGDWREERKETGCLSEGTAMYPSLPPSSQPSTPGQSLSCILHSVMYPAVTS